MADPIRPKPLKLRATRHARHAEWIVWLPWPGPGEVAIQGATHRVVGRGASPAAAEHDYWSLVAQIQNGPTC